MPEEQQHQFSRRHNPKAALCLTQELHLLPAE